MRDWIQQRSERFDHDHEKGFVAVFLALILVIMLIFAAFTVDFGSWYTRSAELKRAADAAALAGVVWMPEFDQAQQYAVATAAKNGFVNGQNNVTVTVEDVPNNNRQLRVTIRDAKAKQFFSRLVTQSQSIGRSSLAEYVLPVPLGSPKNTFGTGDLLERNRQGELLGRGERLLLGSRERRQAPVEVRVVFDVVIDVGVSAERIAGVGRRLRPQRLPLRDRPPAGLDLAEARRVRRRVQPGRHDRSPRR